MPNVMAALPNIGGTLCSTPQSLADAQYLTAVQKRCQDAKPVEIYWGAPNYPIDLIASGPKFTILSGHVKEVSLLNKFFPIVDTCLTCEDIARQNCTMVCRWRLFGDLLRPAFPASRAQHVSDLRPKFTLRPVA